MSTPTRTALVLILLLALAGCSSAPLSTHPQVVLDASFTPSEASGILDAFDAWHKAVPELVFRHTVQLHYDVMRAAQADTIYIVRNTDNQDPCPIPEGKINVGSVAREYTDDHNVVICLDAGYVDEKRGRWKEATLHEVGHALGLDHAPAPSVMAIPYGNVASEPQPADIANVRRIWGL